MQIKANKMWRTPFHYTKDSTGTMQLVVEKFRDGSELNEKEEQYLYWYIWQYVDAYEIKPKGYWHMQSMNLNDVKQFIVSVLPSYRINPFGSIPETNMVENKAA